MSKKQSKFFYRDGQKWERWPTPEEIKERQEREKIEQEKKKKKDARMAMEREKAEKLRDQRERTFKEKQKQALEKAEREKERIDNEIREEQEKERERVEKENSERKERERLIREERESIEKEIRDKIIREERDKFQKERDSIEKELRKSIETELSAGSDAVVSGVFVDDQSSGKVIDLNPGPSNRLTTAEVLSGEEFGENDKEEDPEDELVNLALEIQGRMHEIFLDKDCKVSVARRLSNELKQLMEVIIRQSKSISFLKGKVEGLKEKKGICDS